MSKQIALLPLALLYAISTARADGAPASVDSDVIPYQIDLNLTLDRGQVRTQIYKLELSAGQGDHS